MQANGIARESITEQMSEDEFLEYVLKIIENVLKEQQYRTEIYSIWNNQDSLFVLVFHIDGDIFSIDLSRDFIKELQRKGPYNLDYYLWAKIEDFGVSLKTDHYLETVFLN